MIWQRGSVKSKYRQLSLKDTFSNCQDLLIEDSPSFFQLLDEHFDIHASGQEAAWEGIRP